MIILSGITLLSIACFMLVFFRIGIVDVAKTAISTAQGGFSAVRAADIDDDAKEQAVQAAGMKLVVLTGSLIWRSVVTLAAAMVPVLLAQLVGLSPMSASLTFMGRWDVILVVTVLVTLAWFAKARLWPS